MNSNPWMFSAGMVTGIILCLVLWVVLPLQDCTTAQSFADYSDPADRIDRIAKEMCG